MSWDVMLVRGPRLYTSIEDLPDGVDPFLELGPRSLVHERVSAVFLGTVWSDPSWGHWSDPEVGSVEFNVGDEERVDIGTVMLHVRAGDDVVMMINELCRSAGWQPIDCTAGVLLDQVEDPVQGLHRWRAYRDRVIGQASDAVDGGLGQP